MSCVSDWMFFSISLSGTQSAAPTVKELVMSQLLTMRWAVVTN